MASGLRLLPKTDLIQTSPVDHADWNYAGLLGWLQRRRFALLLSLLGEGPFPRLLEIGYGSGVLMPELAVRCGELFGADPHPRHREVQEILGAHGVAATLACAGATELPYEDGFFDAAVAVSALEYAPDADAAGSEIRRVLRPGGRLVVVTPGHSPLLDLGLRIATGEDATSEYGNRRQRLVPGLLGHLELERERRFPPVLGRLAPVYRGLRLVRR